MQRNIQSRRGFLCSYTSHPSTLQKFPSQSSKPLWFRCRALRKLNTKLNFFLFTGACIFGAGLLSKKNNRGSSTEKVISGRNFSSYLLNAHKKLGLLFICFKTRSNFQFHIQNLYVTFQPRAYFLCLSYKHLN